VKAIVVVLKGNLSHVLLFRENPRRKESGLISFCAEEGERSQRREREDNQRHSCIRIGNWNRFRPLLVSELTAGQSLAMERSYL